MKKSEKTGSKTIAPVVMKTEEVPAHTVDLRSHAKTIARLMPQVEEIVKIENETQLDGAINLLSEIKAEMEKVEKTKNDILGPLDLVRKGINALFKPHEDNLKFAEKALKSGVSDYRAMVSRKLAEDAERVRRQQAAGKLSAATAERKLEAIKEAELPNTIKSSGGGSVTFVTERKLVIDDEKKIPRKFFVLDEVAVKKALKAGEHVPGVHLEGDKSGVSAS